MTTATYDTATRQWSDRATARFAADGGAVSLPILRLRDEAVSLVLLVMRGAWSDPDLPATVAWQRDNVAVDVTHSTWTEQDTDCDGTESYEQQRLTVAVWAQGPMPELGNWRHQLLTPEYFDHHLRAYVERGGWVPDWITGW